MLTILAFTHRQRDLFDILKAYAHFNPDVGSSAVGHFFSSHSLIHDRLHIDWLLSGDGSACWNDAHADPRRGIRLIPNVAYFE